MIGEWQVQEILRQYEKHGWILRRVLLSAEARSILPATIFVSAEIFDSDFDALWFSRASLNGAETWELRHLSATPFALIETFDADDEAEVREEIRHELQTQMRERASNLNTRK